MRGFIVRTVSFLVTISMLLALLCSCNLITATEATRINIKGDSRIEVAVGETLRLEVEADGALLAPVVWESSNPYIQVSESGVVSAPLVATGIITATYKDFSDTVIIAVVAKSDVNPDNTDDGDGGFDDTNGDDIVIPVDKYVNMSYNEFYADYKPAVNLLDAKLRSEKGFMSGSIEVPDQAPVNAKYQPMSGDKYIRNTAAYYSDGGETYTVVDGYGKKVMRIFKGGGYITIEEVAAYLYAFGEVPANYDSDKNCDYVYDSQKSEWGEYLRLNDTKFSGSTSKYPYEPKLPNISGCGGSLQYYEIDVGTTGTDCDPKYRAEIYNDGYSITRGAARLVYVKSDSGRFVTDPNARYVFYTYNHYNDFQEYLNYYGGWGEMFGNITGGGALSSKYDYSPTPYVVCERADLTARAQAEIIFIGFIPAKKYAA